MKSLKSVIGATITLGAFSLGMSASADVYNPRFSVPEFHGSSGANTSSSFAAASLMGEHGFTNTFLGVVQAVPPADAETFVTSACTSKTKDLSPPTTPSGPPLSVWPSTCNPTGMANALNAFTGAHWIVYTQPGTVAGQTNALNETVISLQTFGSPAVVPIYGQADHWVTINQITATPVSPGVFNILQVKGFDGGPTGGRWDSSFNTYNAGLQSWSGNTWKNVFFLVVTAINPNCDFQPGGCGAAPQLDPFYNKYVLMFEPPVAQLPKVDASFLKSPGIVPAGRMNAHLAQHRLWDALIAAGVHKDADVWNAISNASAGPASLVNAVYPDGSPWNYYLVPLLTSATTAIAFVELDASDGNFNHIQVLPAPVQFTAPEKTKAAQLAGGALGNSERLTSSGVLTWDPRNNSELARSPSFPYYEFGVVDGNGKNSTARVMLHNGAAVRAK